MGADHQAKNNGLVWISEAGNKSNDALKYNRRKVRQQAMRHVLATQDRDKERKPPTFKFIEGYPNRPAAIHEETEETENSTPETRPTRRKANQRPRRWIVHALKRTETRVIVQRPAQTGYSAARAKYHFDLLDLCMFTNVHMGRAAATALHNSKPRMREWLRAREPSFLDFIPQLYSTSLLLRNVVDCVLARGQKILSPGSQVSDATIYSLYGQALQGLQDALNDKDRVYEADVLCSVQIMQLFEVLDFSQPGFWTRHTSGITRLIQMRGPNRYQTHFERALLCSQLGTIFGEALLQNKDCFLGNPEWQATLHEIIRMEDPKVPPLLVAVWALEVRLPRLIRQTSEVILSGSCDMESVAMVSINLRHFRDLSLEWRRWALSCTNTADQDASKLPENLAIAYAGDIIANRALVALRPLHLDAISLESETMELSGKITQTAQQLRTSAARGDALIARTLLVATMANACQEDFAKAMTGNPEYVDGSTGYITPKVWQHFNGLMGRKVLPGYIKREDLLRELHETGSWLATSKEPEKFFDGTLWNSNASPIPVLSTLASVKNLASRALRRQWPENMPNEVPSEVESPAFVYTPMVHAA